MPCRLLFPCYHKLINIWINWYLIAKKLVLSLPCYPKDVLSCTELSPPVDGAVPPSHPLSFDTTTAGWKSTSAHLSSPIRWGFLDEMSFDEKGDKDPKRK